MVRRPPQMFGALPFRREILNAGTEALSEIGAGTIAQLRLGAGDVGKAVPDISNPRGRMNGLDVGPENRIDPIDELQQRGSSAAGNVVNLAGGPWRLCG